MHARRTGPWPRLIVHVRVHAQALVHAGCAKHVGLAANSGKPDDGRWLDGLKLNLTPAVAEGPLVARAQGTESRHILTLVNVPLWT